MTLSPWFVWGWCRICHAGPMEITRSGHRCLSCREYDDD